VVTAEVPPGEPSAGGPEDPGGDDGAVATAPSPHTGGNGRRRRALVVAAVVLIAAIIAAVLLFAATNVVGNTGPLGVNNDVRLTVTPQRGGCNTTFDFVATGTLHGTGTMVYRFDQSDGLTSGNISLPVTSNEHSFRLTRQWRLQDSLDVPETLTFRIVQPSSHTATQMISYTCA